MKKILLSLAILAAFSTASFAQLSGGVRAGLNLANNSGDVENNSMKVGLQLGVYLVGNLSDKLAIQPELVYSGYGSSYDEGDYKLGYISIPILLRYNINDMVNIHLGPQFGILSSAKFEDEDVKDGLKGLDTGLALGVGFDFGAFNAGARYYAGLSNIADSDESDVKNTALQLVVGYRLFGGE
jgi:hypothetical protein